MVMPFYAFAGAVSWPVIKAVYRLRAQGLEYLPEGGFVLAANHTSNFDPWPLGMPLWPRRQLRFMAKSELFNPVLAPMLTRAVRAEAGDNVGFLRADAQRLPLRDQTVDRLWWNARQTGAKVAEARPLRAVAKNVRDEGITNHRRIRRVVGDHHTLIRPVRDQVPGASYRDARLHLGLVVVAVSSPSCIGTDFRSDCA